MISIFTPTYNRKTLLKELKKCLDCQTNFEFEWIIVDDGSTDGTKEMANLWEKEKNQYMINFIRQENQGKHIAFNTAVQKANGEWFICVDSDDKLTQNAVEIMLQDVRSKKVNSQDIGIVYPRDLKGSNDKIAWEKIDGKKIDIIDLKEKYKIPESAILLRRKYLLNNQFPKFKQEKFLPEGWLYQKLIHEGKFLAQNKVFYIAEYLEEGLTKNIWRLWKKNPEGILNILKTKYYIMNKYSGKDKILGKIKCIINLNSLCLATGKNILKYTPSNSMSIIFLLPSNYFCYKRYR